MTKVIIIGNGSIGTELYNQISSREDWSVSYVFSIDSVLNGLNKPIDDISNWKEYSADVVFLAIPTDDGKIAFEYIKHYAGKGVPVITCEKGALSNYFPELVTYIGNKLLGISATVGGGTRMIPYLRSRQEGKRADSLVGVLNGTLNYIFSRLSEGIKKEDVLNEVLENKFAEPGAVTFDEIISGETGDLHKKGVILANLSGMFNSLKLDGVFELDSTKINDAINNPIDHRFLVVISREKPTGFLGGVQYVENEWFLNIGLFNTKDVSKEIVLPTGVNNALYIQEGGSVFTISGPGAGPEPTANAMILDALDLLQ